MSDASLRCRSLGYLTDQDSKTVKVYSQAGMVISIGEKSLVSLGARGKFNVLECDSRTITRVCRLEHGRRNLRLGFASGLNAVPRRSAE